jgi:hypothetical protein
MVMAEGNYGEKATGLFGWANNNPSSKNAIYDTEFINSAAGGGNVGEMMVGMRGKGKVASSFPCRPTDFPQTLDPEPKPEPEPEPVTGPARVVMPSLTPDAMSAG